MAFSADRLLATVIAARASCRRRLNGLDVEDGGTGLVAAGTLAVDHQRDIVDRAKQEQANEAAKPPVNRLPRRKMHRQHPPFAARTHQVADRIQDLPQVDTLLATRSRSPRQQRRYRRQLLVRQITGIALGLALDPAMPVTALAGPHPDSESTPAAIRNSFQTASKAGERECHLGHPRPEQPNGGLST